MIDETLLTELADGRVAEPRPLREIASRAVQLRRRRRAASSGVVTLALVSALGVAIPVLHGGPDAAQVQPPASETNQHKDCLSGTTSSPTLQEVSQLLYLPSAKLAGTVQGEPAAREDHPTCDAPTTGGSWYSLGDGGRVTRTLTVTGPAETDYYTKPGAPEMGDGRTYPVEVGGQPGTLHYAAPLQLGRLFWSTPDGSGWFVEGHGLTRDQLVAAAADLTLRSDQVVEQARPPAGLDETVPRSGLPTGLRAGMWFDVMFGTGKGNTYGNFDEPTTRSELQVAPVSVTGLAPGVGDRSVVINGRPGWLSPPVGGNVDVRWSPAPGVGASLTAKGSVAHALALARSVVRVTPDDPRLR